MSAMRYVGGGSFYIGIPARDLTAEEAEQHRDVLAGSPLYEPLDNEPAGEPANGMSSEQLPADEDSEGE